MALTAVVSPVDDSESPGLPLVVTNEQNPHMHHERQQMQHMTNESLQTNNTSNNHIDNDDNNNDNNNNDNNNNRSNDNSSNRNNLLINRGTKYSNSNYQINGSPDQSSLIVLQPGGMGYSTMLPSFSHYPSGKCYYIKQNKTAQLG